MIVEIQVYEGVYDLVHSNKCVLSHLPIISMTTPNGSIGFLNFLLEIDCLVVAFKNATCPINKNSWFQTSVNLANWKALPTLKKCENIPFSIKYSTFYPPCLQTMNQIGLYKKGLGIRVPLLYNCHGLNTSCMQAMNFPLFTFSSLQKLKSS